MANLTESPIMPELPAHERSWTSSIEAYYRAFDSYLEELSVAARKSGEDGQKYITIRYLIELVEQQKDAEALLVYGKWALRTRNVYALSDTVGILRVMRDCDVLELITEDKIDSCHLIGTTMRRYGINTNNPVDTSEVWHCSYLAFLDPALTPKIVMLANQGVRNAKDMRERLALMEEVPLSLCEGTL